MKKILNFFFNVDPYIILEPDKFVTSLNLSSILKNLLFFFKKVQLKKIIKYFFFLLQDEVYFNKNNSSKLFIIFSIKGPFSFAK